MSSRGRAVVPGHVTGFFGVHRGTTAATTGSIGGGIALDEPVTVTVTPLDTKMAPPAGQTVFNGEPTAIAPVEQLREELELAMDVTVETALPLGAGFGVSGAITLGTALAANSALALGQTRNTLRRAAHIAEVNADTGLGDVMGQAAGGLSLRLSPGADGDIDWIPADRRIEYLTRGAIDTTRILTSDTDQLTAAGKRALQTVRDQPTVETFMRASRQFAQESGVVPPAIADIIEAVVAAGGHATMAMLGKTIVALDTGLSDAGYDPVGTRIDQTGARLQSDGF